MNALDAQATEYELVVMLDPEASDERRDQIAADAQKRIEAGGNLKHDRAWGMRKLAYEIRQRTEADYRFFRFESDGPLLEELDHNLKITDGVLRFRIFRVDSDSPVIEPPPPVALAGAATSRGPSGRRGSGPGGRAPRGPETAEPAEEAGPETSGPERPASETPAPEASSADQPAVEPSETETPAEGSEGPGAAASEGEDQDSSSAAR